MVGKVDRAELLGSARSFDFVLHGFQCWFMIGINASAAMATSMPVARVMEGMLNLPKIPANSRDHRRTGEPIRFGLGCLVVLLAWQAATGIVRAAINVACVGDSITIGSDLRGETYPAKLQKLLGTGYNVQNFGVSGTTLLISGDFPYWTSSAYAPSHGNPTPPDIVIILLGSNDSKPWNWTYGTNFITNYTSLIGTYTRLPTQPRVLLCTPPPVFGSGAFSISPFVVATSIAPTVRQLGVNLGREVIDMHALLAGHAEWFPDNVHPNSRGTSVMAAILYTALQGDTMNGVIPSLTVVPAGKNKVALNWPAAGAGWVLQTTSRLDAVPSWVVDNRLAANDGVSLRFTNTIITGGAAMFRLWRPTN